MKSGGEWKEVRVEEIFTGKNGDFDIQQKHINNTGEFIITSGLQNNGILGKSDIKAKIFDSNTITVDMFGNAFFRNYKYKLVTHARVFSLYSKNFIVNEKIGLYFVSQFAYFSKIFSYSNMCSYNKIKDLKITLPFLNGKIYFSYMEKYIEELEALRIEELDAYLVATGLKNYRLTEYDEEVLDKFNKLSETSSDRQTDRIRLGDIFNIKTPKKKYNANAVVFGGVYPYVARGESNNGIKGYITEDVNYLNDGNTISFGQDTATMFYQSEPYFTGDKIKVFEPKDFILSRHNALYFITATKKIINTFSWGATLYNVGNLENIEVEMPIQNEKLDISFMEDFIKVVEKLVIKDVVIWADKKIEATKQIASRN